MCSCFVDFCVNKYINKFDFIKDDTLFKKIKNSTYLFHIECKYIQVLKLIINIYIISYHMFNLNFSYSYNSSTKVVKINKNLLI